MAMRHPLNKAPSRQFQRIFGEINGGLAFVAALVAHPQNTVAHRHSGITGVAPTGALEQGMVVSLFDINPPELRPLLLPSGAIGCHRLADSVAPQPEGVRWEADKERARPP